MQASQMHHMRFLTLFYKTRVAEFKWRVSTVSALNPLPANQHWFSGQKKNADTVAYTHPETFNQSF